MADLSKITLPSGTTYNLKDQYARDILETLAGYTKFLGVTTTPLVDGSTTNPVTIGGTSITAQSGDIVTYASSEFIFNGAAWQEFGDLSGLGALAFKDSATGSFTPAGTVSKPTFTGSSSNVTVTVSDNTNGNYTPAGTVSAPTFTGSASTSTGKFTPSGSVTVTTNATTNKTATVSSTTGTATYTPAGTVSQPTFSGSSMASTGTFTPSGSVALTNTNRTATVSTTTGTATYTPSGTVSAPIVTVERTPVTIKNPTSQTVAKTVVAAAPGATAPANAITYYNVNGETLSLYQLGYTTGASITTENESVLSDLSVDVSASEFTGTGVRLVTDNISVPSSATFTGEEGDVNVTGTPTGTVSQPTFTGTGARLVTGNIAVPNTYTATFTGAEGNVSVSGTPSGTVSQPTFSGTKVQIAGTTTAAGSVSQPTFTGTQGTVTVS